MFSKFLSILAVTFFLAVTLCNAERSGPRRLDSLSERSLSAGSENTSMSERAISPGSQLANLESRRLGKDDSPAVLFNRGLFDYRYELVSLGKRQTGVSAKEDLGDSNPIPQPQNLNNLGDSAPLQGQANGAMNPFVKRSPPSSEPVPPCVPKKAYPFPHPVPEPYQINEISHLLATRGKADGTIEHF